MKTSHSRIHKVKQHLTSWNLDAVLITDVTDLYYLTGVTLSVGALLVTRKGVRLFVDGRYLEMCQRKAPCKVCLSDNDALRKYLHLRCRGKLGFDSSRTSYHAFSTLRRNILAINRQRSPRDKLHLVPLQMPLAQFRAVKDVSERKLLRQAALLGCQGFDYACSVLREGISEQEVAKKLEIFWLQKGAEAVAFEPIVAFGINTSMPHYVPGNVKLRRGQHVLLDIGVKVGGYCSDMTRVVFFGSPRKKILEIYGVVKEAQEAALALCKPGTPAFVLDDTAREVIAAHGYEKFFTHGLGHGIGLNVHEFPAIKNIASSKNVLLEPGMAFTVEPGIYLPGVGGVRIEDTIIINQRSYNNMTPRSKDIVVL